MNPLPIVRENECPPACGDCCKGNTPFNVSDVEKLIPFLRGKPRLERQFRFWNQDPAWCPFLTSERKCFVYNARPSVCRAFGHVPHMPCPLEKRGQAKFTRWTEDEIKSHVDELADRGRATRVVPAAWLGAVIVKAVRNGTGARMDVPTMSLEQYDEMVKANNFKWIAETRIDYRRREWKPS